jgi:hypothetical protein
MIGSFSLRWTKPRVTISGLPDDRAGLLVDGDDDHEDPVVGERSTVAQTISPTSPTDRPSTKT